MEFRLMVVEGGRGGGGGGVEDLVSELSVCALNYTLLARLLLTSDQSQTDTRKSGRRQPCRRRRIRLLLFLHLT